MNQARFAVNPVVLDNGKVLVAGGENGTGNTAYSVAELYDSTSGQWSFTGSMNQYRQAAPTVKLSDGRILIISGQVGPGPTVTSTSEIYDPSTGRDIYW